MSTTLPIGGQDPVMTAPAQDYASFLQDTLRGGYGVSAGQNDRQRPFPLNLFAAWRKRQKAIAQLRYLIETAPDHILSDIGLSAYQVEKEIHRLESIPFFKP